MMWWAWPASKALASMDLKRMHCAIGLAEDPGGHGGESRTGEIMK